MLLHVCSNVLRPIHFNLAQLAKFAFSMLHVVFPFSAVPGARLVIIVLAIAVLHEITVLTDVDVAVLMHDLDVFAASELKCEELVQSVRELEAKTVQQATEVDDVKEKDKSIFFTRPSNLHAAPPLPGDPIT